MEFKIGQKYVVDFKEHGEHGNVIEITDSDDNYCNYKTIKGNYGHSSFSVASEFSRKLVPYNDTKIIITTDGITTTARLYEGGKNLIKTAEAKCSPADTFDFETGAKLAFERLITKEYFEKGKRYIFDLEKYRKAMGRSEEATPKWACEATGKPVKVISKTRGTALKYGVMPNWCIEAPDETIKVGDRVKVINTGKICPNDTLWVTKNVHDKVLVAKFSYGDELGYDEGIRSVDSDFIVRVIACNKAYIQMIGVYEEKCYLIGLDGLQKE